MTPVKAIRVASYKIQNTVNAILWNKNHFDWMMHVISQIVADQSALS